MLTVETPRELAECLSDLVLACLDFANLATTVAEEMEWEQVADDLADVAGAAKRLTGRSDVAAPE